MLLLLLQVAVLLSLCRESVELSASKPNIVYILTDDQDVKLGSLDVQKSVKSLLLEEGLFFHNAFVTTPVCCPSRSSILTGKFVHNHHTYENGVDKGCSSPSWRELNENKTVGLYMSMAGYDTGFFGKYLNNYGLSVSGAGLDHVPPGWTKWFTLQGNSRYYNYAVSNDGVAEKHGDDYEKDYFTDVIREQAVDFINQRSKTGKPFFMYIAPPAPHRPATPAPQYNTTFSGKPAPHTPSYGYDGKDKHWLISKGTPEMTSAIEEAIDLLYEGRLGTLLSVDDLVTAVVQALEEQNVINNTYIFYNSDHGYHLGQFNQQGEKRQPYDEDIRVPLIVRGPAVKKNSASFELALNIDLAPTFLDLAGWPIPPDMDGASLKPVLFDEQSSSTDDSEFQFLVEYFGEGTSKTGCMSGVSTVPFLHDCWNNTFLALRASDGKSQNSTFVEFFKSDQVPLNTSEIYFTEYYDLTKDSWQLVNKVGSLSEAELQMLKETVWKMHSCSGTSCRDLRKKVK